MTCNRYVLCIKDPATNSQRFEARGILQSLHEKYIHKIYNDSQMLMRMMYRVNLSTASSLFNCTLWKGDVEKAYMQ